MRSRLKETVRRIGVPGSAEIRPAGLAGSAGMIDGRVTCRLNVPDNIPWEPPAGSGREPREDPGPKEDDAAVTPLGRRVFQD